MKRGEPIENVALSEGIDTGIVYSLEFEAFEACVAAGLDVERWEGGDYPKTLMAKTMAWYRSRNHIKAHQEDEIAKHAKRKGRRK